MSKERISASVDPDVAAYLGKDSVNCSGLINELVKQHMNGGANEDQIREFRKQQVKSEYEELASRAKRKIQEYNELERRDAEIKQQEQQEKKQTLQDAINAFDVVELSSMDNPMVDATDDELQEYADDLDMSVDKLRDAILTEAR